MQQRKVVGVSGRPTGTDGSDFSFRMVVESRYTKVAKGKSQLYKLIIAQAIIQSVGFLSLVISVAKKDGVDNLAVASSVISAISFLIGALGLRHSKVNLLRFFVVASSTAVLLSLTPVGRRSFLIEIFNDPSQWQTKKFLFFEIVSVVFGALVQIFAIVTTISLVQNMSPPKKAS